MKDSVKYGSWKRHAVCTCREESYIIECDNIDNLKCVVCARCGDSFGNSTVEVRRRMVEYSGPWYNRRHSSKYVTRDE